MVRKPSRTEAAPAVIKPIEASSPRSVGTRAPAGRSRSAQGTRGKNASDYSRKSGGENYKAKSRMSTRKKLIIGIASGVVALLAIAAIVFAVIYNNINNSLGIDDQGRLDNLNEVLSVPPANEPFYTLLLGSDSRDPDSTEGSRSDTIMLARVDPTVPQVTILSIPRDTKVEIKGYGTQKINAAYAFGQEAGAVTAVENLTKVDIAHYAEIDFSGVIDLVDKIGGVTVNVPLACEYKGAKLAAGKQTLNGKQALLFSRCRSFPNGDFQRVVDQRILLQAVAKKVLSKPATELPGLVQSLADSVKTDLKVPEIVGIMQSLQGIDDDHIYMATLPADGAMVGGVSYVVLRADEFKTMMDRVKKGLPPIDPDNPAGGASQTGKGSDSVTGKTTPTPTKKSTSTTKSAKTS